MDLHLSICCHLYLLTHQALVILQTSTSMPSLLFYAMDALFFSCSKEVIIIPWFLIINTLQFNQSLTINNFLVIDVNQYTNKKTDCVFPLFSNKTKIYFCTTSLLYSVHTFLKFLGNLACILFHCQLDLCGNLKFCRKTTEFHVNTTFDFYINWIQNLFKTKIKKWFHI
jgi:hypothetical protein